VLVLPRRPPIGVLCSVEAGRLRGLGQQAQRGRDLTLEIMVRLQALIDHHAL
jgi:hypothetical protein